MHTIDAFYHQAVMMNAEAAGALAKAELHKHGMLDSQSKQNEMEMELAKARRQMHSDVADIELTFDDPRLQELLDEMYDAFSQHQLSDAPTEEEINSPLDWKRRVQKVSDRRLQDYFDELSKLSHFLLELLKH